MAERIEYEEKDHGNGVKTTSNRFYNADFKPYSMCHDCELLNIDTPDKQCPIAVAIFALNRLTITFTPVMECANFQYRDVGRPTIIQGPPPEKDLTV